MDQLSEKELAAVVDAVRALVEGDRAALERMDAYADGSDPYLWTRDVHLVMPPGDPRTWTIDVYRNDETGWAGLVVDMWTREEGRSDLSLELDLWVESDGDLRSEFRGLHVM